MEVGALRLLHDVGLVARLHQAPLMCKVRTFPGTVENTVLLITPWTLLGNKFATGKLFISGVKGAVHRYSQQGNFGDGKGMERVCAAGNINVS